MNCAFKQGETISFNHDSFVIEALIGRGASSIVYRAKRQGINTEHLLKEYHPQDIELYRDEARVLRIKDESMQSRFKKGLDRFVMGYKLQMHLRENSALKNSICNVQNIYEGYGTCFIEMTVFSGKTYDRVTEKTLKDLLLRIKAITKTVSCFHDMGYLLLDIKPANVFTDPENVGMIMLFDFDSAVAKSDIIRLKDWEASSTRGWCAPELESENYKAYISEKTDVYSIGMILYHKLTGKLMEAGAKSPKKLYMPLDTTLELLKDADNSILESLTDLLLHSLCSINYRWSTEKVISALENLIKELDRLEFASDVHAEPNPSTPVHVQVDVDKVEKQISKLHITILVSAILICIPIFFLCFSSLLSESEEPINGTTEITRPEHLQQTEMTDTTSQSTTDTQTESNPANITEASTTIPTQGEEESTSLSSSENQNEYVYVFDTIAYTSEDFRSLIVTNDGVVYYIDGNTISNSSGDISLDMQTDFDSPLENGYLAYDPYNDIVYLLAGGSLTIYEISDLSSPTLIMDDTGIDLEYASGTTPQIAILPDGSLLVPADLDGTYRVDLTNKHISPFNRIYSLQSPYYARLIGDNIMTLREGSTEATIIPLYGGQEYAIQLECDAPYKSSVCAVGDHLLFYYDGVGVCQINADGAFSILIAQEDIKVKDYQSLDYNNIWSIAANQNGVTAFYDNTLTCIRCILPA